MNTTAPFNRLLWKERRVLRNVWLMCGISVMFLMLLILAIGESTEHSRGYSASFWIFMVWIPPVYVLAALATMFAGEREEGTLVWLTTLSPRLSTVISSRLLFVIVTGIALQVWYGLSALALSQFDERPRLDAGDFQESLVIMSFLLVESLAYGMFWSLQTNRPLNAILYAAITIILVNSGAAMLTEALGGRMQVRPQDALGYALGFWGWARCLLVVATMVANWKLAGQWLDGRPWDWEWAAAWWSRRRMKTLPGTSGVAVLPAEASEPWRRAWQRLRWLEWQSLRSFAWIVLGMTLLSGFSIHFWVNRRPSFGFSFAICWLVLIIGGLMSWHGEQAQQRFRALVRLGISPLALWANKLACWLTATLLAIGMIQGTTALWWIVISVFENQSAAGRHAPLRELWMESSAVPNAEAIFSLMAMYCLTLFALGFACSHLLRKTALSLGVTLIGAALFSLWFAVCGELGLPWYLFFAPIPLWLLWISTSALPAWWTEQTTWRVSYRRMGALALQAVFPFVILGLAAGYRVWEVPTVRAQVPTLVDPTSWNAAMIANHAAADKAWEQVAELLRRPLVIPPEITIPEDRQELFYRQPMILIQFGKDEATSRRALVATNQVTVDELTSCVWGLSASASYQSSSLQGLWSHLYAPLTLYAAQHALEDGQTEESLRYLHAAVRMSGLIRRLIPPMQVAAYATPHFRSELLRWAQHPQQTEETLRRGLQLCAPELKFWQVQPEELYFTRKAELQEANNVYWPWERARARKLVDIAYSNRVQHLQMCRSGQLPSGLDSAMRTSPAGRLFLRPGDARLAAWNFSASEWKGRYFARQDPVYGLEPGIIDFMYSGENQYRATLALMAVVGHRRLHGTLPGSLFDVQPYFEMAGDSSAAGATLAASMNDVWIGAPFGYAPHGFPVKEPQFPADSVYRQPLLWTGESRQYRVDMRHNQIQRMTDWYGFWTNANIREDSKGDDKSWIFPIPPQDEEEPVPARP